MTCTALARRGCCAALLLLAPLAAAEAFLSAELPLDLAAGADPLTDGLMQLQLQATPRLEVDFDSGAALVVSTRLRVDAEQQLEPGRPRLSSYGPASRPLELGDVGTLELRDVYWEQPLANGLARVGKQQIVWGRLDGIKLLDVLNPQNFREFILDDFGNSRISLWSAYLDMSFGDWRMELAAIPDYSAHEIPEPGAWFELQAPRFRFGASPATPALPTATDGSRSSREDGALGLRLSRPLGRVDVSVLAYSGSDHEPLGRLRPEREGLVLERFHRRRELLGFSMETALGGMALRAEAGFQLDRTFNARAAGGLSTVEGDQLSGALAADIDGPFGVLVNLQFLWDEILDAPPGLVRPDRDRLTTLFLRRGFLYDTLRLEGRWYHSLDDGDDLFGLSLHYDSGDNTTLYLRAEGFDGRAEGLFGQFSGRDRLLVGIRHTF